MAAKKINIIFVTALLPALLLLALLPSKTSAQHTRYIIELKDKGENTFSLNNPAAYLSNRAIERRTRYGIAIDSTDLPVSAGYVSQLAAINNVEVLGTSRWLNAVLVKLHNPAALNVINQLSFVKNNKAIANIALPEQTDYLERKNESVQPLARGEIISAHAGLATTTMSNVLDYGESSGQINIHEGNYLHNLGFTGKGITIAMIDAGYNSLNTNPAFDSIRLSGRVYGGYDFVLNTPTISNHHLHGSYCLSVIAANRPGVIVGSATGAGFWLLRTENAATEYLIEEFYWAQGAEFADSVGADIISSSLGYTSFDDPAMNHSYANRDGNTSMATIAGDLAAKKGLIVVNSAGNSGGLATDERYISCPADGDSVLAVGAVNSSLQIAGFSSWGPNANGKVKPNVVSIGQGTVLANAAGNPVSGNGTSFSAPNISGLLASLWQAFPEFNNMEILQAVQENSDRYLNPDERYGFGIPNFKLAYEYLEKKRIQRELENLLAEDDFKIFPNPFYSSFNIAFLPKTGDKNFVQITDTYGRILFREYVNVTEGRAFHLPVHQLNGMPAGIYFITIGDAKGIRTKKLVKARF